MKKIIICIFIAAFLVSLVSCGNSPAVPTSQPTETVDSSTVPTEASTAVPTEPTATEPTATEPTETESASEATSSEPVVEPESEYISGVETLDKYVEYEDFRSDIENMRNKRYLSYTNFNEFKKYFPKNANDGVFISDQEIKDLRDNKKYRHPIF